MRLTALKALFVPNTRKSSARRRTAYPFRPKFDVLEDRRMLTIWWVDNNPANFVAHPADFHDIDDALASATVVNGDTIKVSPGVGPYDGALTVDKSLTIIGGQPRLAGEHGATIVEVPTSSNFGFSLAADKITLKRFTIRPGAAAGTDVTGITTNFAFSGEQILNNILAGNTIGLYLNSNGARANTVRGNTFAANLLPGSAQGNAIYSDQGLKNTTISNNYFSGDTQAITLVGGSSAFSSVGTHSKIQILNNTLNDDGAMILVNTTNSKIIGNKVTNPNDDAVASGIFFGGAVTNTEVSCNLLQGDPSTGSGINLRLSDVTLGGAYNVAHDPADNPIPNSGIKITDNNISGWGDSGIRLREGTHDVWVARNWVFANGTFEDSSTGDGISIEDSYANLVERNTANSNYSNGIRLRNAQANTVKHNTANNNGNTGNVAAGSNNGILVEGGSDNNTFSHNTTYHNGNFLTSVGDGIRIVDSDSNTVSHNTAKNNANDGIHVLGTSSLNIIKRNSAKNNGNWDLEDETVGGGTAGTANTWINNTAGSRSPAGLL